MDAGHTQEGVEIRLAWDTKGVSTIESFQSNTWLNYWADDTLSQPE